MREANRAVRLVGITAGKNDFIPGIRTEDQLLGAGIFDPKLYDELIPVESSSAIDGMLLLIRRCGVLGGPSSGAHMAGSLAYLRKVDGTLTSRATAVTIICDRVEWYLSYLRERRPELFKEKPKASSIFVLSSAEVANAPQVPFREAERWVSDTGALVIDSRAPAAFAIGSFPGAVNIPGATLERLLDQRQSFVGQGRAVLFVCPVGDQSRRFAAQLVRLGGRGFSLTGGLMAWRGGDCSIESHARKGREMGIW